MGVRGAQVHKETAAAWQQPKAHTGRGRTAPGRALSAHSSPALPCWRLFLHPGSQGHTLCAKQTCGIFPIVYLAQSVAVHLFEMQSDSYGVKVILYTGSPGGHFTLPAWAGGSCLQCSCLARNRGWLGGSHLASSSSRSSLPLSTSRFPLLSW